MCGGWWLMPKLTNCQWAKNNWFWSVLPILEPVYHSYHRFKGWARKSRKITREQGQGRGKWNSIFRMLQDHLTEEIIEATVAWKRFQQEQSRQSGKRKVSTALPLRNCWQLLLCFILLIKFSISFPPLLPVLPRTLVPSHTILLPFSSKNGGLPGILTNLGISSCSNTRYMFY